MKNAYLKYFIFCVGLLILSERASAQLKVGNNPTTLTPSSMLEIESTNRGLLLPRISLSSTINAAMGAPGATRDAVAGMTVYNTNAGITGTSAYPANGAGNYTFDGTGWVYGDLPKGGATGQVLSRTTTGTSWITPGSQIQIYDVKSTTASSRAYGIIVTATGLGVTYDVNANTNTLTVNIPAGVRLLSLRVIESQARFGNADTIYFVFKTDAADNLNNNDDGFLRGTIPMMQFYNYGVSPPPVVSRAFRMESATNNQLTVSVTQMTSYSQFLFLFNF